MGYGLWVWVGVRPRLGAPSIALKARGVRSGWRAKSDAACTWSSPHAARAAARQLSVTAQPASPAARRLKRRSDAEGSPG
eukprot:scaffold6122_cov45-Phaeocystis_antarctica.AAC.2